MYADSGHVQVVDDAQPCEVEAGEVLLSLSDRVG